jgi:AraC-like DNA-binding protein
MNYRVIQPPNALRGYVLAYWTLESGHRTSPYIHRTVADCCPELLFHYSGYFDELIPDGAPIPSFASGLHAASDRIRRFRIDQGFGIFGATLYPYSLPFLLSASPVELLNATPDTHSLLGSEGRELEERMMTAGTNTERFGIISDFLLKRVSAARSKDHPVLTAIKDMTMAPGKQRVRNLAETYNISPRQFERKFREYSGMPPKLYTRIARFQRAVRSYGTNAHGTLTGLALDCGYYDQSHFIRDFKTFSGYHPGQYFAGKAAEATCFLDG